MKLYAVLNTWGRTYWTLHPTSPKQAAALLAGSYWYRFSDGTSASLSFQKERPDHGVKSLDLCGYAWMATSVRLVGRICTQDANATLRKRALRYCGCAVCVEERERWKAKRPSLYRPVGAGFALWSRTVRARMTQKVQA